MVEGIGVVAADYGVTEEQFAAWGVDPSSPVGWEFPDIAHRLGEVAAGGNNGMARFLGLSVTFAAVLSMIGLFIGNSLGGTRVSLRPGRGWHDAAMARACPPEVCARPGWPSSCAVIYTIFSLQAFAALVVIDVFLQTLVILMEFAALWKFRRTLPDVPPAKVPGGYVGLVLVTLGPTAVILLAIYSQVARGGSRVR